MIGDLIENTKAFFILMFYLFTLWPYEVIRSFLPRSRKDINGEILFITGAGSGIGRGMAIRFAKHGATVICTDVNKETSEETAQMIRDNGGKAHSYKLDVTDRHAVYALADEIKRDIGPVTILVNNAGIVTGRDFMECPDELMIKTMEVNTISHFWTLKAFLGDMKQKNHGHVVSIASIAGYGGAPKLVDYCASKFGAVGIAESLAVELHTEAPGVKLTAICPWFIKTGMFEGTKSCSPILLPMLTPEYTCDTIVAGVLNNEELIFIPRHLSAVLIAKSILPISVGMKLAEYLKLHDQMTNFKGRQTKKVE